ncbi:MAG: filamentous hemagglutinin N-terminal domain-containing protein [Nostoc sp.]|uniref:two-partner secretion domain-containing protein n=1 Tax=Nostoc sp. TaxID=1180 RepID=UPI002FF541AF
MNNSRKFAYGKPGLFRALGTIIPIAIVSILTSNTCLAQIIPDTTLGNQNSRVMSGVNIKGNGADLIEGGVQSGTNLFHSFAEFNVNNGQRVYFANPTGVANILSRVTGNNPSNILGTLGVNGAANLFLLNPNGIIFGPNAQLDIQGSFLATTANSFQFPDGSEFSATNPQAPPLLTMSVPVGVQFGSQPTASITNQGNLVTGKDLTLNAGSLDLQGQLQAGGNLTLQAQDTLKVRDSATNPLIAAAGGNLLVQGNQKVDISDLNHPDSGFFSGGNMVFKSENTIGGDAHFWAGGNFRIENLNGDLGNLNFSDEADDDIENWTYYPLVIRAIGDVSFGSYKGASLHILAGGSVNISGNVDITGVDTTSNSIKETVTLSDGTEININDRQTPTLDIRGGVDSNYIGVPNVTPNPLIGFNPQNPTITNTPTNANISIQGDIYNTSGFKYNSGKILLTNQYHPNELTGDITTGVISTYGDVFVDSRRNITTNGKIDTTINDYVKENRTGGSIKLLANQNILIQGHLLSNVNDSLNGNGGDIDLNSRNGKIDIKADIISKSPNNGIAGSIKIKAADNISLFNKIEGISNNAKEEDYNDIVINSTGGSVYLNGSTLDSTSNGLGYAGNIEINAHDQISILNNSKISSKGNLGLIFIGNIYGTKTLVIDNSIINTNNENVGIAGYISINASDKISILNGSKISSQVENVSSNSYSGYINIKTNSLSLNQNSQINTNNNGSGDAGYISINASDKISILNGSKISSQVENGSPNSYSGYINIKTNSLSLNQNSQINTNNNGSGDAGLISINARDQISILNGSKISSQGNVGNIDITTKDLLLRRQSKISTTAGKEGSGGNAGKITINTKDGFVIAVPSEDSDIIANAFGGQGGKINIHTNLTLGLQNRGKLSPIELKDIENNHSSDISASSDVGAEGQVAIETLSTDPSQGLVALPTNLVDPSRLIAQGCSSNSNVAKGQSEFVITGRGGLPPSPDDTLKPGAILPEWVVNNTVSNSNNSGNMTESNLRQLSSNTSTPLVEAVGMVRSANGDIVLTAQSTTVTLLQSGLSTQACNVTQGNVR